MLNSKQKLFITFIVFAIILSAVNVSVEKLYFEDSVQKVALNNALNKTKEREGVFKNFLFQSEQTLYSIQKLDSFNEYLLNSSNRIQLENIFLSYAMSQTSFMQLRYIDKDGFEKIRIDRDKENLQPFIIPQNKLQNKANRYYFYDSKTKPLNKVWFSALDLNMEKGKVEVPYRPTIRAMLPIQKDGNFNGVLIINYLMDDFIKKFTNAPLYDMILCDAKGYPLYHYEKSKSWGYYSDPKYTIENDFPNNYKNILKNEIAQTEHFVSRKLDVPVYGGLYLILQLKKSYIDEQNKQSALQFISTSLITLITSFILAFLVVKIFSNKLLNITKLQTLNESLEDSNEELEQSLDNLKQTTHLYETEKLKKDLALQSGNIGVWEWIYDTNTLIWDDIMYRIYGIEKDEEKPSPYEMWSNTINPNDKPGVEENLFNAKETNGEYNATFKITTSKGKTRYIHALGRNELDSNGNAVRMVGTNTDITEIREKDRLIAEQTKLASMGEMIGNIAHQWRQPLSVISTGATGLKIQKEYNALSDEQFVKICDAINDNAQYLSKTIDDFRNFIKGEGEIVEFKLVDNIESFLNLVEGTIKNNNITIVKNIQEDIIINSYPNELIQCFINIFNNAKDALKDIKDDRYYFISAKIENNEVVIAFKDNAGGMLEDILPKIFEPYFTTKHQSQGTGLGLSMTYNLITSGMNGIIEAYNVNYEYKGNQYIGAELLIKLPL